MYLFVRHTGSFEEFSEMMWLMAVNEAEVTGLSH
jgi:hypothetical protein